MGIQVTETKNLNTGAELSEFYVGLRKNHQYHINIQISPDSNTYTISAIFDHHINKDSKTQGKIMVGSEVITVSNVSTTSNIIPVAEMYTNLKKKYTNFTDDI